MWSSTVIHILIIIGVVIGTFAIALHKSKTLNGLPFYVSLLFAGSCIILATAIERINTGNAGVFLTISSIVCTFVVTIMLHDAITAYNDRKKPLKSYIRIKH